jgi:hypothetical protein
MVIPKNALIAGGIGALAIGGFMLFKGHGDDTKAEAPKETGKPKNDGGGGLNPTGLPSGEQATPQGTGQVQGEQVGAYTLVPDAASGMTIVVETATQTPVAVQDQAGNLTPVTVDAQGNIVPVQDQSTASTLAPQTGGTIANEGPGLTPPQGTVANEGPGLTPSNGATTADVQAGYAAIAASMFANAGNPAIGSASSSAMSGQAALGTGAPTLGAENGAATGSGAANTAASMPGAQQVGAYTVIPDAASGLKLVIDTASQTPVGVMDAQGKVTPVSLDASGNLVPASSTTAPTAPSSAAGGTMLAGAPAPAGVPASGLAAY